MAIDSAVLPFIGDFHQTKHDGHFNKYSNYRYQRSTRIEPKQGNRNSNGQFEEITRANHRSWGAYLIGEFQKFARKPA